MHIHYELVWCKTEINKERGEEEVSVLIWEERNEFFWFTTLVYFQLCSQKIHFFNPEPSYDIYSVSLGIAERETLIKTHPLSITEILSIKNFLFDAFPIPYNIWLIVTLMREYSLNIVMEISATLVHGGCRISLIESQ